MLLDSPALEIGDGTEGIKNLIWLPYKLIKSPVQSFRSGEV